APHGGEVIAEVAGDLASRTEVTRQAMEELGHRMEKAQPETVVVITPHGVRVADAVCVMTTDRALGMLGGAAGHIEMDLAVDAQLAHQIAERASQLYGVPTATAIYGASGGGGCFAPLGSGRLVAFGVLG